MTAVEWLVEQIKLKYDLDLYHVKKEISQAKEMENKQLNIARLDGINLANKGYGK